MRPAFSAPTVARDSTAKSPASAGTETFTARRTTIGESMQTFVTVINPRLVKHYVSGRGRFRRVFLLRDCDWHRWIFMQVYIFVNRSKISRQIFSIRYYKEQCRHFG